MKSSALGVVIMLLLAGCSRLPSEDVAYRLACEALKNDASLSSKGAQPASFEDTGLYIAKGAGCVLLPFQFVDEQGATVSASYTVWLKRVEPRWIAEHAYLTPTYPVADSKP
jgi:hypothetical protein